MSPARRNLAAVHLTDALRPFEAASGMSSVTEVIHGRTPAGALPGRDRHPARPGRAVAARLTG